MALNPNLVYKTNGGSIFLPFFWTACAPLFGGDRGCRVSRIGRRPLPGETRRKTSPSPRCLLCWRTRRRGVYPTTPPSRRRAPARAKRGVLHTHHRRADPHFIAPFGLPPRDTRATRGGPVMGSRTRVPEDTPPRDSFRSALPLRTWAIDPDRRVPRYVGPWSRRHLLARERPRGSRPRATRSNIHPAMVDIVSPRQSRLGKPFFACGLLAACVSEFVFRGCVEYIFRDRIMRCSCPALAPAVGISASLCQF